MFKTTFLGLFFLVSLTISVGVSAKQTYTLSNGEVLLDPTEPYSVKKNTVSKKKGGQPNLSLNYIMSAGNNRRAMINGKKVHEGDYVSGAKVRKIDPEYVSLLYDGKEIVLYLNKLTKIRR